MKFRILHETPGRIRLRACVRSMTLDEADLLEAWILTLPGVEQASVHERTCSVTVIYAGDRAALVCALAGFAYESASTQMQPLPHSSRA